MRHFVKKTQRGGVSKEQMDIAVKSVTEGNTSIREANYKTLGRYVKKFQAHGELPASIGYRKNPQVFDDAIELTMVDYIKKASQIYHGLTRMNIRELAYKLGQANDVQMLKTWIEREAAGVDWFTKFMQRHRTLSIRAPEPTSIARMSNFNQANVTSFFNNLSPQCIYNVDKTGVVTVQ